jgi:uncharacterized membrane protein YfhO
MVTDDEAFCSIESCPVYVGLVPVLPLVFPLFTWSMQQQSFSVSLIFPELHLSFILCEFPKPVASVFSSPLLLTVPGLYAMLCT